MKVTLDAVLADQIFQTLMGDEVGRAGGSSRRTPSTFGTSTLSGPAGGRWGVFRDRRRSSLMRRRSEIRGDGRALTHPSAALLAVALHVVPASGPGAGPRRVDHHIAGELGTSFSCGGTRRRAVRLAASRSICTAHASRRSLRSTCRFRVIRGGRPGERRLRSIYGLRGYGGSQPPDGRSAGSIRRRGPTRPCASRGRDVDQGAEGVSSVALLGWATGGHCWPLRVVYPENVSHLIPQHALRQRPATRSVGSSLEDPGPGRFNRVRRLPASTAESLFGAWDASIPLEGKASGGIRVATACRGGAASDPTSHAGSRPASGAQRRNGGQLLPASDALGMPRRSPGDAGHRPSDWSRRRTPRC